MNKFTLTLAAAALLCTGAQAQLVKSHEAARNSSRTEILSNQETDTRQSLTKEQRQKARKAGRRHAAGSRVVPGPSADLKIIDETPAGKETESVKTGFAYGYSWLTGLISQNIFGGLTNVVVDEDSKHVYIQNPIYFNYLSEENWIVGSLEGDEVTFTFPQLISYEAYKDDDGNIEQEYFDYALCLEFVVEDEESQQGWYYPSEKQTYRMRLGADGSLTPLENEEEVMIGMCAWFDSDDLDEGEEPYWSWQGNGDFYYGIRPLTEEALEIPADVEMNEWQMISGISSRPVNVGVKDDKMYITGLFNSFKSPHTSHSPTTLTMPIINWHSPS